MSVTLKLATSLDGRIATGSGESHWITGPSARAAVHAMRAEHDAVVIGVETALADDPQLNVRIDGYAGRQPARVVLDSKQRMRRDSKLAATAGEIPTFCVSVEPPAADLAATGVRVLQVVADADGRPNLRAVVEALAAEGLATLFVEGGGKVAAAVLSAGLVDRLEWFRAPIILGQEGRSSIGGMDLQRLADAPRLRRASVEVLGDDLWERYERA